MNGTLGGLFVVLMTPLDDAGSQDEKSLRRMLDYYVNARVSGFTVLAESSERDRLSDSEKGANLKIVFDKLQGKLPIVVGTGRESTRLTIEDSQRAESRGATALMVPPPRNPKLRDLAIFDFFAAVGDSVGVPLVIQDFPQNDRPYMSPELIARIYREVKNAQYLKLEDSPTPIKLEKVRALVGDKLKVFGALYGRDAFWELDQGAVGIMTATATPEYLVSMLDEFRRGNRERALDIYLYSLPLAYFLADVGIAVRKEILVQRGVIQTAKMKQPSSELTPSARRQLAETLGWVEHRMNEIVGVRPHRIVGGAPL